MTSVLKKAVLGLTAASTLAVATATPADAQRYYRHYRHHGDAGLAIGAGILGLGLGAAIASSSRPYYGPGYGYYGDPYYGYGYRCVVRRHWDPYWGRWVRVRYC